MSEVIAVDAKRRGALGFPGVVGFFRDSGHPRPLAVPPKALAETPVDGVPPGAYLEGAGA